MKKVTRAELNEIVLNKFRKQYIEVTGFSHTWVENKIEQYRKELEDDKLPPHYAITKTEHYLNYDFRNKNVLIIGLGLSFLIVNDFIKKGANIYGIEPDNKRIDVQYLNAKLLNIPTERIKKGVAENIPFEDDMFDFVFCFTVLEHVQDVKKSLSEMYRVLKKKSGILFIETPNYRIPHEPHYKIRFPFYLFGITYFYSLLHPKIQKSIIKLGLLLLNRPTNFLKTINFLNEKSIKKIFYANNWKFLQLNFKIEKTNKSIYYKFYKYHHIQRNLWFYIFKDD